jgi:hypothetical protein
MISSTSITSTSGVTLISDSMPPLSREGDIAMNAVYVLARPAGEGLAR